ncbi:Rossmann-fold NAD(P)-binding domain-containing protein [Peribacillus butanolivorans]
MVLPLTKNIIQILGLFNPFMKEVVEIMYLTKEGFILNGEKYEKRIGPIPKTPYKEGMEETLRLLMMEN